MLLLTESQVQPCNLLRQNIFEEVALSGVEFQGKFFFLVSQYAVDQGMSARQDALTRFTRGNEQLAILMVEAKDRFTLWQEDPELKLCSDRKAKLQRIKQMDLAKVTQKIHEPGGIDIRDRRKGFRRKKNCFIAQDLAEWLEKTYRITGNDSIRLAQRMVDEKVIYHLAHKVKFAVNGDFYRFYDDEV